MGGNMCWSFFAVFFALSDDDGWEKTAHELMVLYGDDEMAMPFTHTQMSAIVFAMVSLSLLVLFSGGSLLSLQRAVQERARKRVAV